ncbi:MAG: DUF1080 domain-containing protein [Pirellulaceae bacterium]
MKPPLHAASLLIVLTASLAPGLVLGADESAAEAGYTISLFDGKTLEGWQVTGCDAVVTDGAILLKDGDGFLRTNQRYADFVLELEWKALREEKYDSGIYIRSELPAEGKNWPNRYQVNLLQGKEGALLGAKETGPMGLIKPGDWNRFKLTVVGASAALEINGKPAWKVEDALEAPSGYIGIQSEVPGGGQFLFRNLQVTELGYQSLFNGRDFSGWEGADAEAAACWAVEDGVLVGLEEKGPWLRSKQQYGDFDLRLQYKVKEGGNSGVYVRVPESGNHHGKDAGVEIQLLDDHAERYAKLKPYQFTGSVYAVAPSTQHVGRPAGEWNQLEIQTRGQSYRVTHNGVVIVDADVESFPLLEERLLKGYLGFQNHGGGVWLRAIRLGPPLP